MPIPEGSSGVVVLQNGNGHHSYGNNELETAPSADEIDNMVVMEGHQEDGTERKNGRHRPRKRKLYSEICKQVEFYFSDANITKNRMMREIVEQANETTEGFVDLSVFLDFTKIQRLSATIAHIQKALVTSDKLELSSDAQKARRRVPFDASKLKSETDVEECTIYVENVPRDSDHEWLEKIFQAFGPVAYISLPKFKSGQHKGFGFVEFDDAEAAGRCLEAYGEEGACLPSDIDPAQLRSIQSFNEEESQNKRALSKTPEQTAGASNSKNSEDKAGNHKTKRKASKSLPPAEEEPKAKRVKQEGSKESSGSSSSGSDDETTAMNTEEIKSKKRKRRKNKINKSVEVKLESESIMLKVLPKKSWRQLRNRYLNLQRSNMAKLKKQLQQQQLRTQHYKNFYKHPQEQELKQEIKEEPKQEQEAANEDEYAKTYDHIMEMKLRKGGESVEAFKRKISIELAEQDEDEAVISGFIKFVDYKENDLQAFVRVNGEESFSSRAENLLKKAQETFASARYLSVKEVDEYKRNVQAALKQKQKEQPRRNVRGKDRLMKAATKTNHIRFDNSEDETEDKMKEMETKEVAA